MARDRQRAKQRKARRAGRAQNPGPAPSKLATRRTSRASSSTPPARSRSSRPRSSRRGRRARPTPSTTRSSRSPGLRRGRGGRGRLRGRAQRRRRRYLEERPSPPLPPSAEVAAAPAGGTPTRRGPARFIGFLRASWAELQRVQWPDRRQVGQATAVVIGFVVIAGAYLGLADGSPRRSSTSSSSDEELYEPMFRWYVVNTYSGHENKVKQNLEHRVASLEPEARRAPGRRADRDRVRDEGQPEGPGREAHDARLRAREHGAQRRLLGARQGHARASPASSARPTSPCR